MKDNISVREARAQDVDQVVDLIYSAAPEMFDYMFKAHGKTAQDFIRYEFQQGGGFMGHRIHKVALDGETIKGIGAFYTGAQYANRMERDQALWLVGGYQNADPRQLL